MMMHPHGSKTYRAAGPSVLGYPVLALLSTSTMPQVATVHCLNETGGKKQSQIRLAPGEMALTGACAAGKAKLAAINAGIAQETLDTKGATGLSVTTSGKSGKLAVYGFAYHENKNDAVYTALNFTDAGIARSGNTVFAGVPVGRADALPGDVFQPEIAMANFGRQPVKATVLYATTKEGPSGLQSANKTATVVIVPPQTSRTVALPPLNGDPLMRNSFVVQSDATPGSFYANLTAVGGPTFKTVQLLGKDQRQSENAGGHPWTIVNHTRSTLLLFNHSGQTHWFNVNIGAGGVLWHQEYQVASMETRALGINDLIATGAKDKKGKAPPSGATSGEVSWFNANAGEVAGRLLVSNPTTSLARNFSCGYNIVLCGALLENSYAQFAYLADGSLGPVDAQLCTAYDPIACSGGQYSQGGSGYNYLWTSTSPSIAPVSGSNTDASAAFYGQYPGTGGATARISNATCNQTGGGQNAVVLTATLNVSTTAFTTSVSGGSATISPSVTLGPAPPGVTGMVTISVSDPSNPSGVTLSAGVGGTTFGPFTLGNGQSSQSQSFLVKSDAGNTHSGTLSYVVTGTGTGPDNMPVSFSPSSKSVSVAFQL